MKKIIPNTLIRKKSEQIAKRSQKQIQSLSIHPYSSTQNNYLDQQYKNLRQATQKKLQQFKNKQKIYRIQIFKNQKYKDDVLQIDKQINLTKLKIGLELYQKNKDNKDSPLFYNQHGLCPFQLLMLNQKRYDQIAQGLICMVCFMDIHINQIVINLPCEHTFHKDCAVQHVLGSKLCPSCSEVIDVAEYTKKKLSKTSMKN